MRYNPRKEPVIKRDLHEARELYALWYRHGYLPTEGARRRYAAPLRYLIEHKDTIHTVLDAGCGRGMLLPTIEEHGFSVTGTQFIAPWMPAFENVFVYDLAYQELGMMVEWGMRFDAVLSIDVIEHMFDVNEMREAVRTLRKLAIKALIIAVGLKQIQNEHPMCFEFVGGAAWTKELESLLGKAKVLYSDEKIRRVRGRVAWLWEFDG